MRISRIFTVFTLAALLVACGGAAPAAEQPTAAPDAALTEPTVAPEGGDAAVEPTAEPEADTGSDTTDGEADTWTAEQYAANLENLTSYTLTFNYTVTTDGKEDVWSWTQSTQAEPELSVATWQDTSNSGAGTTTLVTSADEMYLVTGDPKTCMIVTNTDENSAIFDPNTIMSGFEQEMTAAGAGPDVNGRPTDKYTYDSTMPDGSKYTSTVLVDQGEQYTVQWDVTGANKNGDKLEPFSWSYKLSDINAVPPITVPAECAAMAEASWPMPDDAAVNMQTAEMFSFTTAQSMKDMAKFYADAMPAAGYTAAEGGMDTPEMVLQQYSKDGKQVSVMISTSDGKTSVIITIAES